MVGTWFMTYRFCSFMTLIWAWCLQAKLDHWLRANGIKHPTSLIFKVFIDSRLNSPFRGLIQPISKKFFYNSLALFFVCSTECKLDRKMVRRRHGADSVYNLGFCLCNSTSSLKQLLNNESVLGTSMLQPHCVGTKGHQMWKSMLMSLFTNIIQ